MKTAIVPCTIALLVGLAGSAFASELTLESAPPVVVKTVPVAGATNIDPALTEIRVTFSKPMQDGTASGSAWGEENLPESAGNPHYLADSRTCVLPVKLKPDHLYAVWVNSERVQEFKDAGGRTALPYLLTFRTGGNRIQPDQGYDYTVQTGDTLSVIVQAFRRRGIQVTADQILKANPGLNWSRMRVGQKILIPAPTPPSADTVEGLQALVGDFFAHNYRDITARESLEWGEVTRAENGNVSIRYRYRARIWDRQTVTNDQIFTFEPQGKFISVKDAAPKTGAAESPR